MVKKNIFNAIALLSGTAIGAGFLGLPYVAARSGFLIALFYLILIGAFVLFVQLCMGEVVLRTRGNHHFAGYAKTYMGKNARRIVFTSVILYIFSALVAYLVAGGQSLSFFIFGNQDLALWTTLALWFFLSCLTFVGLRALKHFGKIGFLLIILFVISITFLFIGNVSLDNLNYINLNEVFLPVGVVLFAFFSFAALPAAERLLLGREDLLKKAIIWGSIIPFIVYLVFTFVIVGNFGNKVSEIATLSLGKNFAIFGVVVLFTSFISMSISMRDLLRFDFKINRAKAWIICAFVPLFAFLVIYFFELAGFIEILSLAGIIAGGITGIFILFLNLEAKEKGKRKPEYVVPLNFKVVFALTAIFIMGIVFELLRRFLWS